MGSVLIRGVRMTQLTVDLRVMWRVIKRDHGTVVPIMVNGVENVIYYVTKHQLEGVIEKPSESHRRKYLTCIDDRWIAVDNTSGEAWTEEFETFVKAASWLTLDHMSAADIRNVR